MSDDPQEDQVPDEEEASEEDGPLSVEELRAQAEEISSRAKTAGLKPFRSMVRAYLDQTLDAVDGLLSALEGKNNKRKKGD